MPQRPYKWRWPPPGVRDTSWQATEQICKEAINRSGTRNASLAFSTGKDSLAMLLCMRHFFDELIPVYWYLIPDLGFVERSLQYYERIFDVQVQRLPHPDRFDMLSYFVFQPPNRISPLDWIMAPIDDYTMDSLFGEVRVALKLDKEGRQPGPGAMHATGIRASDSPIRASLYRKHGGFAPNGLLFYPVITWNLDDIEALLEYTGVKLPPEYAWLGRSFDGIMQRYLEPIREHYPEDYRRIQNDFPLVDLEFFRANHVGPGRRKPVYRLVGRERNI